MPELAELEAYRSAAGRALGREIAAVPVADPAYLKGGLSAATLEAAGRGRRFDRVRRFGKLLLLRISPGEAEVVIRLGMTGHLLVDGLDAADPSPSKPAVTGSWDRVAWRFSDGGGLVVRDRRRLGGVSLDPDLSHLGPDVLALTEDQLACAMVHSTQAVKARLLDQSVVAGIGNLSADEALWCAGVDPVRPASSLDATEVGGLYDCLAATAREAIARGGSRHGPLGTLRAHGGPCPRDGTPLVRRRIGGRTTWSCPRHQR